MAFIEVRVFVARLNIASSYDEAFGLLNPLMYNFMKSIKNN